MQDLFIKIKYIIIIIKVADEYLDKQGWLPVEPIQCIGVVVGSGICIQNI
jgi:hypothetical protein